jgi:cytochrome P450
MAELMRKPETMKKLQDEVRGVVKRNELIRTEDLSNMEYLRAVIKEILRLHPPTPLLLPRLTMEECKIDGFTIPKGTRTLVNCWAIQRDPKLWEAPEEFKPERFVGSQVDYKGNDFHFIPFGAGRRICPGFLMATATAELALANLVHQFDWELPKGTTIDNFDMSEEPALSVHRKDSIELVAKKVSL